MLCLVLLLASGPGPKLPPAFLDAPDRIRVWLPQFIDPSRQRPKVHVIFEGKDVPVTTVASAPPIAPPANPKPGMIVLAGSFQHLLGGADWQPGSEASSMHQIAPGRFEWETHLPAGHFEYKIAKGGSWDENYGAGFSAGGSNLTIDVPKAGANVRWIVDFNQKQILNSIANPHQVPTPDHITTHIRSPQPQSTNVLELRLAKPIDPQKVDRPMSVQIENEPTRTLVPRGILDRPELSSEGINLGALYQRHVTTFRTWCPLAQAAELILDNRILAMHPHSNGVYSVQVSGDNIGRRYRFRFHTATGTREAVDIWTHAATQDGKWSVVADVEENPVKPVKPWIPTDSPVYELSVADFTADPNSQVPAEMRSKYAGMTAKTPGLTGLNYLKWLGIGAVQIMPIEMWNPAHRNDYNWGYETYLFNVPESQYSGHPEQPLSAVKEVKSMVSKFHQSGISVVMDVVYNHSVPSEGVGSPFWQTQPYFFFRTDDAGHVLNESGVGNALDDDRPYVRRYIRDSLIFWAKNYGVDGFRFDLMGMFARTSLLDWRKALDRLRPGIVMYGEPWTGGGPLRFGKGDQKGTHIAVFNDNFRNAIRGDLDGTAPGYAMGNRALAPAVAIGLKGSTSDFTATPSESINYVSVHDNRTLWDKIAATLPGVTADARKKVLEKCGELILTAQGIPFLEGGAELGRTKGGNNNSYNAVVAVNQFDWKRAATFQSVANRYRDLIKERKEHAEIFSDPATRSQTKILPNGQIRLTYQFGKSTISFTE